MMREVHQAQPLIALLVQANEADLLRQKAYFDPKRFTLVTQSSLDDFETAAFPVRLDILLVDEAFDRDAIHTFMGRVLLSFPDVKTVLLCDSLKSETLNFYQQLHICSFLPKHFDKKMLEVCFDDLHKQHLNQERLDSYHSALALETAVNQSYVLSKASPEGLITFVNQNFCDLTGYNEDELIGKSYKVIAHPNTPKSLYEELWTIILAKEVYRKRITNRTKRKEDFIVDLTIIPIVNAYDELQEFLCFMEDVTEVIAIGRRLNEEKMAHERELSAVKDNYLQVFSHELKTPLNSIINFSSYATRQIEKSSLENRDRILDAIAVVEQSGDEISDMVTSLLTLSKIKDNKIDLEISECFVDDIISSVNRKFSFLIAQESIDVEWSVQEECVLESDREKLMQIINAIFSNAIKYGNGKIKVSVRQKAENFVIVIEDNGKGIKNKDEVIALFEQGDSDSMRRESKGVGIGLHLISILCDLLGYTLAIRDSETLGGAKLVCEGPLKRGEE